MRREAHSEVADFSPDARYVLDVELWDIRPRQLMTRHIGQIENLLSSFGGEISDKYLGRSVTLLRIVAPGGAVRALLERPEVRQLDLPPQPDPAVGDLLDLGIGDFPQAPILAENPAQVAVLDSGFHSVHPLIAAAAGESIGVPEDLGADDIYGHGTRVAGIAVYGDLRTPAEARLFEPQVRVHSAKVVTDRGEFHDRILVTTQMRTAIEHFHREHGCRVFNISLGDRRLVFDGNSIGSWPAIIDEIARDLNVVIVVSAGNLQYTSPLGPEPHLENYPRYLLEENSRILEPANAAIAITVGSISHAAAVPPEDYYGVALRPIAPIDAPSPFTRRGPGIQGSTKPDFVDYGGNLTFDGATQRVTDSYPHNSIFCLHNNYLDRLFTTAIGTSYAAPRVAYKAALVSRAFPEGSANLTRALLGNSATIPVIAEEIIHPLEPNAVENIYGLGIPDLSRSIYSEDSRVVLYADSDIQPDQFLIYEVPIIDDFVSVKGDRTISVTLAFDPPTRHTRSDYLGNRMSFRLIRGASLDEVTEHFRRRVGEDEPVPEMPQRNNCALLPGPSKRDIGTLQRGTFTIKRNPSHDYGDTYYLVVRCEKRWAAEEAQKFSLVVEIAHPNVGDLYARVAQRVQVRPRVRL
ncbi:S8 family peptidase [Caulobacter mirabilis]|uniref:S8 family peptidase n=1 Tax=Caulobacter mirabilis TaxID=69666 RepID=UPI001558C6EF|nr:S8 family peptidase [Caulobacter mirabilis]